ncbi:MAG: hypothetical protein BWY43_00378 [candidate division WS2 bacterium ADurb.Bin280]|uniref:Uncharacterized protein n=1 Tax=candidate division WS2 bacterium ADurb.Bin280 TaxID=1852829 RepID=A0A1V5SER6_9BACT|nr:MAG: hypothetical protein BWY43_00378 [candidate division WS2 bacterium ADurb.Bin280]
MTRKGFLFKIEVIAILEFGKIDFGFGVLNIFVFKIFLSSVVVDEIIYGDIGNFNNKNLKIDKKENGGNKKQRNKGIYAGLLEDV